MAHYTADVVISTKAKVYIVDSANPINIYKHKVISISLQHIFVHGFRCRKTSQIKNQLL